MERVLDYITMSMVNDIAFLPLDIYSIVEKPKSKRGNPYLRKAHKARAKDNKRFKIGYYIKVISNLCSDCKCPDNFKYYCISCIY
jgi:hypothetical protein